MRRATTAAPPQRVDIQPSGRFDVLVLMVSAWLVGGLILDGWAHNNVHPLFDTFFTPWHAVLYSGYLAALTVLGGRMLRNRTAGHAWSESLPESYMLSLVGVAIFGVAGLADLIWHTLFGIEVELGTLLSPTHLLLAIGGALIVTGPLRAVTHLESGVTKWADRATALVSLTGLLTILTFMTQYASPFAGLGVGALGRPVDVAGQLADGSPVTLGRMLNLTETRGLFGLLLHSGLVIGTLQVALRGGWLRPGAVWVLLGVNAVLMLLTLGQLERLWPLIVAAIASGIAGDVVLFALRPSATRTAAVRIFATVVPVVFTTGYFLTAFFGFGGIWWALPDVIGTIALTGILGLLLSYVASQASRSQDDLEPGPSDELPAGQHVR